MFDNLAVIILAAGLGKRMKSGKAKVLHEVLGKPMVLYVTETAKQVAGDNVILVIGHQAERVREVVSEAHNVMFALQKEQLGTGHAVLCALPLIPEQVGNALILCGDVPLITGRTLTRFMNEHIKEKRDISLLAVQVDDPKGYGRIITDEKMNLAGIVEEADATEEQRLIKTINSGIYCVKKEFLTTALNRIRPDNAQAEFYLTDIIAIGYNEDKRIGVMVGEDPDEVRGVNNLEDLRKVENLKRER
jgi:UDP-N-acetylglucosamine diphosphorylase/glucosamine-1-phosphate N-acetyltransferase